MSRIPTYHTAGLSPLSKAVPELIIHQYSTEMARQSAVVVADVLMKNESKKSDMIGIMTQMQKYLGSHYLSHCRLLSGGDQLTCERQLAALRHRMDGNTVQEHLRLLEPVAEDWHCLVNLLFVSKVLHKHTYLHIVCMYMQTDKAKEHTYILHIHNNIKV